MAFVPFLQVYVLFAASDPYIHQIGCLKDFSVDIAALINQVLLIFQYFKLCLEKKNQVLSFSYGCFSLNVTATTSSHSQQASTSEHTANFDLKPEKIHECYISFFLIFSDFFHHLELSTMIQKLILDLLKWSSYSIATASNRPQALYWACYSLRLRFIRLALSEIVLTSVCHFVLVCLDVADFFSNEQVAKTRLVYFCLSLYGIIVIF